MTTKRWNAQGWKLRKGPRQQAGFTFLELTAVIVIIFVLVSLLSAALNHTKAKALRITCLDNVRQLQLGWQMYVLENDDSLPLNQRAPVPDHPRIISMVNSDTSWVTGNPRFDLTTENIKRGTLFPYVRSDAVYRCPLDYSRVTGHPDVLRTRSYAMNRLLGGDPDPDISPKTSFSELKNPSPENVFVFIEEHEQSAWDTSFVVLPVPRGKVTMASATWYSTPSDRHQQGCNLSFADGHIEYWRWYSPKTPGAGAQLTGSGREFTDIRRLQAAVPQP
jgi:prepilin-type processing-associated H-X9-DG protein